MVLGIFLFLLALIWIIFATIQDIKTSEISNWLNFSLIIFALGFRFFDSLFQSPSFSFFYQGLIWLTIFFILGNFFYYGKMFAGGDAKLFIALGPVLPISTNFFVNFRSITIFLIIFFLVGGVYSIITSIRLCLKNYPKFKKEFRKQVNENEALINLTMFLSVILGVFGLIINTFLLYFAILFFILPYLYLYAKGLDEVAMIRNVEPKKLREGDWLYKDVKVGNIIIKATWNGLSKKDILILKRQKKRVMIREGIIFMPVFLISFLAFFVFVFFGLRNPFW